MERFPAELIARICSYLCMHCADPDAFPHADTADAILTKASLARFARSSKYICAIAQPYVFHYYATGNMVRFVASTSTGCATDVTHLPEQHENDRLPLFLRSIIRRPDLAARVQALQLIASDNIGDLSKADRLVINRRSEDISMTSGAFRMLRQASVRLDFEYHNLFHPTHHVLMPMTRDLGSLQRGHLALTLALAATARQISPQRIHHSMEQLAILCCPNVSVLAHGITSVDDSLWHLPSGVMSLRKLGLLSHGGSHHFAFHGQDLVRSMPNVETFYAAELNGPLPEAQGRYAMIWGHELHNTRNLVVSDIAALELQYMVKSCPQLRDLEYRHHGHFSKIYAANGDWLLWALMPAQKTLQRLVLVGMADGDPRGDLRPMVIPSLAEFDRLEELAISQIHIDHGPGSGSGTPYSCGTDLAEFLPRSIKDVHIMYVWANFTADLENLARDAPKELPNLRSVRVSHLDFEGRDGREDPDSDPRDEWFPVLEGQYEGVQKSFAAASISMTWDKLPYKMPRQELTTEKPVESGRYMSTPYCFWESPAQSHVS